MSLANLMFSTATVKRRTDTKDASGGQVSTWATVKTLTCNLQPVSSTGKVIYQRDGITISHQLFTSEDPGILTGDVITSGGIDYKMIGGPRNLISVGRVYVLDLVILT